MNDNQAKQIAVLLNARNKLLNHYTAEKVLKAKDRYLLYLDDEVVIACVEVKKVQWYQWEILHLSVAENFEGKKRFHEVWKPDMTSKSDVLGHKSTAFFVQIN